MFLSNETGMLTAGHCRPWGSKTVPCTGFPSGPKRTCTTGLFYADLTWAELFYPGVVPTS